MRDVLPFVFHCVDVLDGEEKVILISFHITLRFFFLISWKLLTAEPGLVGVAPGNGVTTCPP